MIEIDWRDGFIRGERNRPVSCVSNIALALENDAELKDLISPAPLKLTKLQVLLERKHFQGKVERDDIFFAVSLVCEERRQG